MKLEYNDFSIGGLLTVQFSEELYTLEEIITPNMTYINDLKDTILKLDYWMFVDSNSKEEDELIPEIIDWEFTKTNQFYMEIQITFKNPLYVSSGVRNDLLKLKVVNNEMFKTKSNSEFIRKDYETIWFIVPR